MRVMESIKPRIVLHADGTIGGGLNAQEIEAGLKSLGIDVKVGTGLTLLLKQVRAGNPVIAGVYAHAASGTAPLHAIVIEGIETRAGVTGLSIYDPVGWVYWQPITKFQKYFTQHFVMPIQPALSARP